MDTTIKVFDFMARPDASVSNYQRSIVQFRRQPRLIPIGSFLATMEITADDSVGTACTDCVRSIKYSPTYFDSLSVDQCLSALIHEVYHKFLNFFPRFERWAIQYQGRYTRGELVRIFNMAQDYFINYIIKHEWNLPLGDGWLYNPEYSPDKHTTESIANELVKKKDQAAQQGGQAPQQPQPCGDEEGDDAGDSSDSCDGEGPSTEGDDADEGEDGADSSGGSGDTGDEEGEDAEGDGGSPSGEGDDQQAGGGGDELDENDLTDPTDSEAGAGDDIMLPEEYGDDIDNVPDENQIRDMEMNNRQDMSDALRAAKGYGNGESSNPFSSEAEAAAYRTGFDFESELSRFANKAVRHGPWTWFRPNRRLRTSQGISLPSRRGKTIGCAVFVIDSSGSTDGAMVRYFLDETTEALRNLSYEKAVIIYCSDAVAKVFEFTKEEVDAKKSLFNGIVYRAGYGTALAPAFEYVLEHHKDARCITYLTDGGVGTHDVRESAHIINKKLGRVPVLWLLIDEMQYSYVKRFVEWVKEFQAGRCAFLPMDKIRDEE